LVACVNAVAELIPNWTPRLLALLNEAPVLRADGSYSFTTEADVEEFLGELPFARRNEVFKHMR
jgi:hypothetical protein